MTKTDKTKKTTKNGAAAPIAEGAPIAGTDVHDEAAEAAEKRRKPRQSRPQARPWTAEEDAWLLKNFGKVQVREAAAALGRDRNAVADRAEALGLGRKLRHFTPEEDAYILAAIGSATNAAIAEDLGRTPASVHARLNLLKRGRARRSVALSKAMLHAPEECGVRAAALLEEAAERIRAAARMLVSAGAAEQMRGLAERLEECRIASAWTTAERGEEAE